MFDGGTMLDSLRAAGVMPHEIDTIIVSHLHCDHIGGLEVDGEATFTNATVHIGEGDWQYFVEELGGGRRRASGLRSIEERVELVDRDGITILPGLTTRLTPGHTPGHLSAIVSSCGWPYDVLARAACFQSGLADTFGRESGDVGLLTRPFRL